jgi:hypothetical protein
MQWIDRDLLHRGQKSIADKGRRVPGGSARLSDDIYRTRLLEALRNARGIEIEDVFPAGGARAEVHR